jgi:hypothetical protein
MSDVKKPMAGEWWEYDDVDGSKFRLFVVGALRGVVNNFICENSSGEIDKYHLEPMRWKHLPDCDSFDWKSEVFPQYWSCTEEVCAAFNRVDSPEKTVCVMKDGRERPWQFLWAERGDYGYKRLMKEQAEALLLPKESPEDWVVQDRVPARAGIDRGHFGNTGRSPEDMWGFVSDSVGIGEMHGYQGMVVYCRRKDLPEIEPKAETRTVVIIRWLCWNDTGKHRLIHASENPNGFKFCMNVGEEKFEVTL